MGRSDVYLFPIIGSCVLFSLYIISKVCPRFILLAVFKLYFMLGGVFVVAQRIINLIEKLTTPAALEKFQSQQQTLSLESVNTAARPYAIKFNQYYAQAVEKAAVLKPHIATATNAISQVKYKVIELADSPEAAKRAQEQDAAVAPEATSADATAPATAATTGVLAQDGYEITWSSNADDWLPNVIQLNGVYTMGYGLSIFIALFYLLTNHWLANNIFGVCFSLQAIELINLGSYMNGAILLSLLFCYDVFWVFCSEVMVTVAKNIDAPIKLLFPYEPRPSMLGLGDIVIPGIFIAFVLRYDVHLNRPLNYWKPTDGPVQQILATISQQSFIRNKDDQPIATTYFHSVMIGYIFGLFTTVLVMFVFKAAQPALLYLVPACLLFTAGIAFVVSKDEFTQMLHYGDEATASAAPAAPAAAAPVVQPSPVATE